MGCSTHSVPSWSNTAIRSCGGTKLEVERSVVTRTKSRIACFAGPSFQAASGVPDGAGARVVGVCASALVAPRITGIAGAAARSLSRGRRLGLSEDDIMAFLLSLTFEGVETGGPIHRPH